MDSELMIKANNLLDRCLLQYNEPLIIIAHPARVHV